MKKILSIVFAAAFSLTLHAANTYSPQILLNGIPSGIKFVHGAASDNCRMHKGAWLKGEQQEMVLNVGFASTSEWSYGEFRFTPQGSGKIALELTDWVTDGNGKQVSGWVLFDDLKIEGCRIPLKDGNFDEDTDAWRCRVKDDQRSEILEGAGRKNSCAIKVSRDCPAIYKDSILVESGREVRFSCWFKSYNPENQKANTSGNQSETGKK